MCTHHDWIVQDVGESMTHVRVKSRCDHCGSVRTKFVAKPPTTER